MDFVYLAAIICLIGLVVCAALAAWATTREEWERVYFNIGGYPPRVEFEASAGASDSDE